MSRPPAPSMPTDQQVERAVKTVTKHFPDARIKSIGPNGVEFCYPEENAQHSEWDGVPFGAARPSRRGRSNA